MHYGEGTDSGEDVYLGSGSYNVESGSWTVDGNSYKYRLKVKVTDKSGQDLTDYQVKVTINTAWLVSKGYATSSGNEVRFTDDQGSLLSFWRENDFNQEETIYWVKVPSIPANSTVDIYMYFDPDLTGVTDASDPDSTFDFFDDFDGSSLDTNKWDVHEWTAGSHYYEVVNSELHVYAYSPDDPSGYAFSTKEPIIDLVNHPGYRIEVKSRWANLDYVRGGGDVVGVRVMDAPFGTSVSDGRGLAVNLYGDYYVVIRRYSWTNGSYSTTYSNVSDKTSGTAQWVIIVTRSSVNFSLSGTYSHSWTPSALPQKAYYLRLYVIVDYWTNPVKTDSYFDLVLVRKYVDPEPEAKPETTEKCRSDFGDIRFTDSDGVTELSYWMEEKVDGDYAVFWVKVPSIPQPHPKVETGEWTVDGNTYHRRTKITVTEKAGQNLTDYQVQVVINTKWLVDNGYATSNGNEVRFTDSEGNLLSFWRETDFNTEKTIYWVKIPNLSANSTKTIYIYYDEELTAVTDASNGEATFLFFDDFDLGYLDTDKWVEYDSGGTYEFVDSCIYLKPVLNANNAVALRSLLKLTNNIEIQAKIIAETDTYYDLGLVKTENIITNTWHGPEADNIGYWLCAQHRTDTENEYLLRRRDVGSTTKIMDSGYKSPIKYELKYVLRYLDDGGIKGLGILTDETEWFNIYGTDTTYLSDDKYVVIWQGAYSGGWGGYSKWDWVFVRKYVDPEPSVEVETEKATIYIYYGKSDATTTSDPDATFEFYEDFTSDPNTNGKWEVYRSVNDVANEFVYDSANRRVYLTKAVDNKGCFAFLKKNGSLLDCPEPGFAIKTRGGGGGGDGADGWAIGFYKDATPYQTYGRCSRGGSLGLAAYDGSANHQSKGYAVEFDNYQNPFDPTANHNALVDTLTTINPETHHVRKDTNIANEDNATHTIEIYVYNGVKLVVDGSQHFSISLTLDKTYKKLGFGAGTGGLNNNHWIQDYVIIRKYIDPEPSHGAWGSEESITALSLFDSISLSDVVSKSVTKPLSDAVSLSEVVSKVIDKLLFDSLSTSDSMTKGVYKLLSDSISLSDSMTRGLAKFLSLFDTISLYDYMGWVYPYLDPEKPLDRLIAVLDTLDRMGYRLEQLLDDPYIVYLIRYMARKGRGEI